jgi:hypothetical protein
MQLKVISVICLRSRHCLDSNLLEHSLIDLLIGCGAGEEVYRGRTLVGVPVEVEVRD